MIAIKWQSHDVAWALRLRRRPIPEPTGSVRSAVLGTITPGASAVQTSGTWAVSASLSWVAGNLPSTTQVLVDAWVHLSAMTQANFSTTEQQIMRMTCTTGGLNQADNFLVCHRGGLAAGQKSEGTCVYRVQGVFPNTGSAVVNFNLTKVNLLTTGYIITCSVAASCTSVVIIPFV